MHLEKGEREESLASTQSRIDLVRSVLHRVAAAMTQREKPLTARNSPSPRIMAQSIRDKLTKALLSTNNTNYLRDQV
jgi:hypothetical protein